MDRKLPLVIGGLLLVAIITLSALSLIEVRDTTMGVAAERLSGARDQLRESFQQSALNMRALAESAATRPGISAFAAARANADARIRERALADLSTALAQPQTYLGAEIRDANGAVLLSSVPEHYGTAGMPVSDVLPRTEPGEGGIVGGFRAYGDTVFYPVSAPIPGADDLYIVRWRRLGSANAGRQREVLSNLIGGDASLFIGNADGSQWTDFQKPFSGPELPADRAGLAERLVQYDRDDGATYLASVAPIEGTPWLVGVDFPRAGVMAPVAAFARRHALVALAILVAGLAAAWALSRRITRPLGALTVAADRVAAGDVNQKVEIRTGDELEVLGNAFTHMAAEVRASREQLEARVEDRTRELNATLVQLQETQDALVRRERLAMLGQLSSGIGHELRNPLGVMTNAVYYLKTVLAQSPATVHEYLDIVSQQIALSEKIVGDLLDFARQKQPQRKRIPLRHAVESQVERLGKTDGLTVALDIPDDIPDVVVDPVQFGQVMLNLLTNASQAMDGMGGTSRIAIVARAEGDRVHLDVRDSGPGVLATNVEKIFEPLFTTKARGIGLGLSVSRMLARANGGELTLLESVGNAGGGATFRLTLSTTDTTPALPQRGGRLQEAIA